MANLVQLVLPLIVVTPDLFTSQGSTQEGGERSEVNRSGKGEKSQAKGGNKRGMKADLLDGGDGCHHGPLVQLAQFGCETPEAASQRTRHNASEHLQGVRRGVARRTRSHARQTAHTGTHAAVAAERHRKSRR